MKKTFTAFLILCAGSLFGQDYTSFPMWNETLPVQQRVSDLINRLTLEEKVAQMLNATPAVPRLGIQAYDWWNETLHGVARTPFHTTSYPQAIGMAATWDTRALLQMGNFCAIEGRAIYNEAVRTGRTMQRYWGLTYWTPNINIFRDPRWGRGQETYGEDPYLTAMLGNAIVQGLQGNHPFYLKSAACAKHFAVHSGPEPSRHSDNFNPTAYDLWDTYLPAFKKLVTESKVAGVMCAYNALNSEPCCANNLLLNNILRNQWKFTGYVTSDCGAIDDFFRDHKTHTDATAAAVDAVIHSTDVECGNSTYRTLVEAVKKGVIKETELDASLKRLFEIRYRLGMFDAPAKVPLGETPLSALEAPEHKELALEMARESIVLLKNQNNTLPLKKSIKKIAVVGPNADNDIAVLGNYNGTPSRVVTILDGIREKLGNNTNIVYEQAINFTNDTLFVYDNTNMLYRSGGQQGIKAEYFNNDSLSGTPVFTRIEKDIVHVWPEGTSPGDGIAPRNYSAKYTTSFIAAETETLNFEARADDGYRIFINNETKVNAWTRNRWGAKTFSLPVEKNKEYKIVVEYRQGGGEGSISFKTGTYRKTDFAKLSQTLKDADAILFVGGISPQLEGEEMPVNAPGFNGGDRTTIALPSVQTDLMRSLKTTGKPVVFVMMTGSALAINWEESGLPAIINCWYGGQSAGTAVADVLFGDYNPSGRLPITFYKSDADLPDFKNYDMNNRTYRYFKGTPLYPFGYGLSFTTFSYNKLTAPASIKKGSPISISATVANTGPVDGDEVVQLYISHPSFKNKKPLRALKGFERIHLKRGETKTVRFNLKPDDLSLVSETGQSFQPKGPVTISIGGGQPGVKNKTSGNVVNRMITVL